MPLSYVPLSGADQPLTLADLNTRYQSIEDYFLALIAAGGNLRTLVAPAGEGLADRAPAYLDLSSGEIFQMDADAASPKAGIIRGFVDGVTLTGNDATLVVAGSMGGVSGLTALQMVYVGTTAGTITQTRPSPVSGGSQVMIAPMGLATAVDTVNVAPNKIQYQKRDAFADNDLLTVQHHADERGYLRDVWAYVTEVDAAVEATGYSSSNRDSDVRMKFGGVGGTVTPANSGASSLPLRGTPYWQGAQRFIPITGELTQITFVLGANVGSPTGNLNWEIRESDGTTTPSTLVISGSHTPTPSATNTITTSGTMLDGSKTYWFILKAADGMPSSTYYTWQGDNTNPYVDGTALQSLDGGATWSVQSGTDMRCSITTSATLNDKLAQTFTLASDTDIASVGFWLKKIGAPTSTGTARIETVSSGEPTGTLADASASGTFLESSLGASYAETLVTFASDFTLSAGTYALVLGTTGIASLLNYMVWGADGSSPSYAGGEMLAEQSSSWVAESKDAVFSVYSPGVTHPSKVGVDWWLSSYADVVNRYGDGSGVDLSTQTTFKCLRDAGFDDLTVVVEIP